MKVTHQQSTLNKDPITGHLVFNGISASLIQRLTIYKPIIHTDLMHNSFKALAINNCEESKYNMVKFGLTMDAEIRDEVAILRERILKEKFIEVGDLSWIRIPVILEENALALLYKEVSELQDQTDPEIIELNIMFDKIKKQFS